VSRRSTAEQSGHVASIARHRITERRTELRPTTLIRYRFRISMHAPGLAGGGRAFPAGRRRLLGEVAPRECATGAGLKVAFELRRQRFSRKLDHGGHLPRPVLGGVERPSTIVRRKPVRDVRRQTDVVTADDPRAFEDADEALGFGGHTGSGSEAGARAGMPILEQSRQTQE